jgi:hypothetical protein
MSTEIPSIDSESSHKKIVWFPWWLLIIGFAPFLGSAILAGRLVWEQTVWTWARGPQMVGFSLIHTCPIAGLLLLSSLLLFVWLFITVILTVWKLVKKRRISWSIWTSIGISGFVLVTLWLPYGFWQRLFVDRLAKGPHAVEFFTYAAALHDFKTVKAFMSHGVSVNAHTNRDWKTALHGAAVEGDVKMIDYLISKGADINAVDRYGDSPLEEAISMQREEAVKFLIQHGAQRIRGTEAQHDRVAEEIVHKDIEEMEKELPPKFRH